MSTVRLQFSWICAAVLNCSLERRLKSQRTSSWQGRIVYAVCCIKYMCLTLLITELLLVAKLVFQRVNPANSLSYYYVSLFQIISFYFVFSLLLNLLFRSQGSGTFALLFTVISHFIFICCYCNWRHAFVPKRARFIRFCMHNFITVGHNFNQFIAKQRLFLLRLLLLGYIFLVLFSRYDFNFVVCHLQSIQSFFLAFYKQLLVKRIYYTVCVLTSLYSLALVARHYLIIPTNLRIDILNVNLWKKRSE